MIELTQNELHATLRRVPLFLLDPTRTNPVTGQTGVCQLSAFGAAWQDSTNSLVEVGNGHYYVELTATELAYVGYLQIRYKSAATCETQLSCTVRADSPHFRVAATWDKATH